MRSIFLLAVLLVSVAAGLSITSRPTMKPSAPTYQQINHGAGRPTSNLTIAHP